MESSTGNGAITDNHKSNSGSHAVKATEAGDTEDASDCVVNVSRLTTLLSSPDIVPHSSLLSIAVGTALKQHMQVDHGNTSQGTGKSGAKTVTPAGRGHIQLSF